MFVGFEEERERERFWFGFCVGFLLFILFEKLLLIWYSFMEEEEFFKS